MALKILLLVLLVVVVMVLIGIRRPRSAAGRNPADTRSRTDPAATAPMLACAHCGLHLPQSEAVVDRDGRVYCGDTHRLAGPR